MYEIETVELTKKFKNKVAVNKLNLNIKKGELFSLLGTNGAGKTTTIKMLTTLIEPTSGNIKISGLDSKVNKQKIREHQYPKATINKVVIMHENLRRVMVI